MANDPSSDVEASRYGRDADGAALWVFRTRLKWISLAGLNLKIQCSRGVSVIRAEGWHRLGMDDANAATACCLGQAICHFFYVGSRCCTGQGTKVQRVVFKKHGIDENRRAC